MTTNHDRQPAPSDTLAAASSDDQEPSLADRASWVAATIGRTVLRFSGYPGRGLIGASSRKKSKQRGGFSFPVHTDDGQTLDAWYSPADPHAKTHGQERLPIVMLHGWIEVKEFHMPRARRLNRQGHDVILFDHRAHGRSTGKHATFGVREREDLTAVINEAVNREMVGQRLITLGFSMGAATALQHAPHDDRVAGVVAFAPFVNFREAVRSFRFKLAPWMDESWLIRGVGKAMDEVGFTFDEASTIEAVRQLHVPVLLIEGGLDRNLPPRWHTHKLAAAKTHGQVDVITIDEATHCGLCRKDWPGLNDRVAKFCRRLSDRLAQA